MARRGFTAPCADLSAYPAGDSNTQPQDAHHRNKLKGKTSRDERRLLPALPQRYSSLWAQAMDTEFDAAMDSYTKQEELLRVGNRMLGCLPLGRKTRIGQNAIWRTFAPLLRRIFLLLQ